jgi:hypothetical protein
MNEAELLSAVATPDCILLLPTTSSAGTELAPTAMPAAIPADQAYYWSTAWQDDVRELLDALARGEYEEFKSDDPNDVVRWLLSDDDE